MVPVSINLFIPRIPNHCLHFKTFKLASQIVKAQRNVFCSLGYFKTWSLRQSLCRQTSQQASLDGLRYSLAGEMVFDSRIIRRMICESMLSTNAEITPMHCCLGEPDCLACIMLSSNRLAHNMQARPWSLVSILVCFYFHVRPL